MKIRPIVLAFTLAFTLALPCFISCPVRADLSKIVASEKAGGFSYRPPIGWAVEDSAVSEYKIVGAPIEQNMRFRPNLNFQVFHAKVGFDIFVTANVEQIEKELHAKVVSKSRFKTTSGVNGYRVTCEGPQQGYELRYTFYILSAKQNQQFLITATSLASDGARYDDTFDECIKSLKAR